MTSDASRREEIRKRFPNIGRRRRLREARELQEKKDFGLPPVPGHEQHGPLPPSATTGMALEDRSRKEKKPRWKNAQKQLAREARAAQEQMQFAQEQRIPPAIPSSWQFEPGATPDQTADWSGGKQGCGGYAMPLAPPQMQLPHQTFQQPTPAQNPRSMNWMQNQFAPPTPVQQFHTSQQLMNNAMDQHGQSEDNYGGQSSGQPSNPSKAQGTAAHPNKSQNQKRKPPFFGPPASARDKIIPPSRESGGIPDPTPAYLAQTLTPSTPLPHAQALLLVIDLNGTLLFRPDRSRRPKEFEARPHAAKFLQYVTRTFWVVIWSSAREDNVAAMIKKLLPSYSTFDTISETGVATVKDGANANGCALVATWSRRHFGLTAEDYNKRVQCYKRLSSLWGNEAIQRTHPGHGSNELGKKNRWDQSNTVLIDDSSEKARTEPHNLIQIEEFFGGNGGKEDDMLPQVHDYINELCFQRDVSSYMRAKPFKSSEHGWTPQPDGLVGNV